LLIRPIRNIQVRSRSDHGFGFSECFHTKALRPFSGACGLSLVLTPLDFVRIHRAVIVIEKLSSRHAESRANFFHGAPSPTFHQYSTLSFPDAQGWVAVVMGWASRHPAPSGVATILNPTKKLVKGHRSPPGLFC